MIDSVDLERMGHHVGEQERINMCWRASRYAFADRNDVLFAITTATRKLQAGDAVYGAVRALHASAIEHERRMISALLWQNRAPAILDGYGRMLRHGDLFVVDDPIKQNPL